METEHSSQDKAQTELEKQNILRLNNEESNKVTKRCLCMALLYLMNEKDLNDISITEITKRAGVSRTAFYRNYSAKEDLLKEIGADVMEKIIRHINIKDVKRLSYEWFFIWFTELKKSEEVLNLIISAHIQMERLFPRFQEEINSAVGNEKPFSDLYYYKLIAAEAAFHSIATKWLMSGTKESPEEMAKLCESVFYAVAQRDKR